MCARAVSVRALVVGGIGNALLACAVVSCWPRGTLVVLNEQAAEPSQHKNKYRNKNLRNQQADSLLHPCCICHTATHAYTHMAGQVAQ